MIMDTPKKMTRPRMVTALVETFGLNPTMAFIVLLLLAFSGLLAVYWFVESAPPRTLVLTSGPPYSTFQRFATLYGKRLASKGVQLRVLPSNGSLENLQRLESPQSGVDLGFVQGGLAEDAGQSDLVSLGSIAYEPLWVFYRSSTQISRLSELAGQRIAVGAVGSGTHSLALTLLKVNGITGAPTTLLDLATVEAVAGLLDGKLDAVFLMGDSTSLRTVRTLVRTPNVKLFTFAQADAYIRRYAYLNKMELPEGSIDLGLNLPAEDVVLIGPTVELVARKGLHPALSDLLIEVAQEIHGTAGLLQKRGEFPAAIEHEFKISKDALRYYKSGKGLLASAVGSFWLASLLNRILVVFVPILLVLIPTLRLLPIAYRWRIQLRIYRCYRPLLLLERDASGTLTREQGQELLRRLDEIEETVNHLRVPASFADQFYGLRGHIAFVRERLKVQPVA
jgi:TRAP-type uncharacterized transport system substrate-binding protein